MDGGVSRRLFVGGAASGAAVVAVGGCAQERKQAVAAVPAELPHQPGIVTPPPAATTLVSVDVLAADRTAMQSLAAALAARVEKLHKGVPGSTATVAVGASLFDERYGLGSARPRLLTAMPMFPNDVLQAGSCHGDLLFQVCADDARHADAVVRDLLSVGGSMLRERWRIGGFRSQNATVSGLSTSRNLFGFREGSGQSRSH